VSGVLRAGGRAQRHEQSQAARGIRHHGIISLHCISFWGRTFLMQVNDKVADFTLQTEEDKTVHLKDFSGKPVVLFFYPKADTPGCTIEACGFRDVFKKIQQAGAVVLGISRDTPKAQKKFKEKYDLPYTLLADVDEVVCKQFDVLKEKNMYGKKVIGIERTTFLIGPDQKLLKIFPKVKPEGHAEEVLAAVKAAHG
jgi:peroxiredoxin Q/BCP